MGSTNGTYDNLRGVLAAIIAGNFNAVCDAFAAASDANIEDSELFRIIASRISPEKFKQLTYLVNRLRSNLPIKPKSFSGIPIPAETSIAPKGYHKTHFPLGDIVAVADGEELTVEKASVLDKSKFDAVLYLYGDLKLETKQDQAGSFHSRSLSEEHIGYERIQIPAHLMKERGILHTRDDIRKIADAFRTLDTSTINRYMSVYYHLFGQKDNKGPYLIGEYALIKDRKEFTYKMNKEKHYLVLYREIEFLSENP